MFSIEFFNRCNITQPDGASQALRQIHRGHFLVNKVNCLETGNAVSRDMEGYSAYRTSFTKKPHVRHLKACKWRSSSLNGGAVGAAALSISAEDSSSYTSKQDTGVLETGPRDGASALYFGQATGSEELAAIRESALRSKLLRKLSETNQYGRHIQRQLLEKEAALLKCKSELATMETEIQALVGLAQEAAGEGAKQGSRKINGKYIQSHLALRLEEMHERLLLQVKDIDAVCYRNVPLVWYGMAEDVQVMGSFDGWTQGEQLSPENTGYVTKFSATLKLRPGRYEIKFLVDGEWHVSPDWPSVEGLAVNNLLVVE